MMAWENAKETGHWCNCEVSSFCGLEKYSRGMRMKVRL